ncbi:MAG: 6-phosphofructokinase [Patescibacteria group bacterium]|nr:6-phosphofructokinase [Patescibacteria group bacterium]MDD5715398.1 6-phosphofructokinase [Patescibacteria group bacterium]
MKTIGIITSGGDCGGLNAVVKGVAQMASRMGAKTLAIPNGYAGLYNLVNLNTLVELTPQRLDTFSINLAGSEAGHSRVKISKIEDPQKYERIKKGLEKFKIEGLVISGGDDTGSVIIDLAKHGIKCVHAPKTMDLDLVPYSVGGDSAIERIAEFVRDIQTTGRTHNRIMIIEAFGRYAGHVAFRGGIAGECDAILIPEVPVDFKELYRHMKKVYTKRVIESDINAGTYTIVVAEGIKNADGTELYDESAGTDSFGHKKLAGAGKYVAQELKKMLKSDPEIKDFMVSQGMFVEGQYDLPEVRVIVPSHLARCGFTSANDANFGMEAGAGAAYLLLTGVSGVTVTGYRNNTFSHMDIAEAIKRRLVDLDQITIFEQLGFCFGRVRPDFKAKHKKVSGMIDRIY